MSSVVSEIKSGVRGSYAAEKVGTLKVNVLPCSWPNTSGQGEKKKSKGFCFAQTL